MGVYVSSIQQKPIINLGFSYVNGFSFINFPGAVKNLQILPGSARDSTNTNDIISLVPIVINGAIVGANGCDDLPMQPTTLYAVYVIGDSNKNNPTSGLLSKNITLPNLPNNYDMFRLVGYVTTGAGGSLAGILEFDLFGKSSLKRMEFSGIFGAVTNGNSATFVAVNLGVPFNPIFPPINTIAHCEVRLNASSAAAVAEFIPFGSTATSGIVKFGYGITGTQTGDVKIPCGANGSFASIQYRVTAGSTVSLLVIGYLNII